MDDVSVDQKNEQEFSTQEDDLFSKEALEDPLDFNADVEDLPL